MMINGNTIKLELILTKKFNTNLHKYYFNTNAHKYYYANRHNYFMDRRRNSYSFRE